MNEQVTKHTPGPWVWNGKDMPFADVADTRGNVIAGMNESVRHDAQQARAEERANARLIAAAPDLLALAARGASLADAVAESAYDVGKHTEDIRRLAYWALDARYAIRAAQGE